MHFSCTIRYFRGISSLRAAGKDYAILFPFTWTDAYKERTLGLGGAEL